MPLQLVTPPAEEPVSLADAKLHLRVDFTDDDVLITALISAARQAAEMLTGRQIVTARWKLVLDSFPGPSLMGVPAGDPFSLPGHAILAPKSPLASVVSIQYLDMSGTWQTMPATDYTVDATCEPARITPVFGKIWPISLPQIGAVAVTFDAGYGPASSVPEGIKSWIKLRLGSLYAHREEVALINRGKIEAMPFVDGLLDPFKVVLAWPPYARVSWLGTFAFRRAPARKTVLVASNWPWPIWSPSGRTPSPGWGAYRLAGAADTLRVRKMMQAVQDSARRTAISDTGVTCWQTRPFACAGCARFCNIFWEQRAEQGQTGWEVAEI